MRLRTLIIIILPLLLIYPIATLISPTWDPISTAVAAIPLLLLYAGILGIIHILKRRAKRASQAGGKP